MSDFPKYFIAFTILIVLVSAAPARTVLTEANTLYVEPSGNDKTAKKNRPDLPFATIGAALRAVANGESVLIAEGDYPISPGFPSHRTGPSLAPLQLVKKKDVLVEGLGPNVRIIGEGRGDFLMIEDCTNVCVKSLIFQGNRPDVVFEAIPLFGMIMLRANNQYLRFSKCQFYDFGNHGITHLYDPKSSRHVTIEDCYFARGGDFDLSGRGEDGAAVSGIGSHWIIQSNVVDSCVRGFEIEGSNMTIATNIMIQGNTLTNTMNLGIMVFVVSGQSSHFKDINIINNTLLNTRRHTNDYTFPILITGGEKITVMSNIVAVGDYMGIAFNASFSDLKDSRIVGNRVSNIRLRGIQAIDFAPHIISNIVIQGNEVARSGESGILVGGSQFSIQDNQCVDNGLSYVKAGIEVRYGSQDVLVTGNQVWNSTARQWQDYGIWIRDGTSSVSVYDNYIESSRLGSVRNDDLSVDFNILFEEMTLDEDDTLTLEGKGIPELRHDLLTSTNLSEWRFLDSATSDAYGSVRFTLESVLDSEPRFFRLSGSLP